jgi:hypothetical protein
MALTWNDLPQPGSSDHSWTKTYRRFQQAGDVAGYLAWLQQSKPQQLAAWQAAHPPATGTGGTGDTGGVTPAAGGPGAVPIPAPTAIMAPGISYSGRFGGYSDPAYQVAMSYAGPETPGAPVAGGTAPPLATGGPSTGSGGVGGSTGGGRPGAGGFGQGHPGNTGTGSDNPSAGWHGGNDRGGFGGFGRAAGLLSSGGGDGGGLGPGDAINLGRYGTGILDAATMLAPGWAGIGLSALSAGMRGYNAMVSDAQRAPYAQYGVPGLDPLQYAGAALGLNNYGSLSGNRTIVNPEQSPLRYQGVGTAITEGGLYNDGFLGGGPLGIFNDIRGAATPAEADLKLMSKPDYFANLDRAIAAAKGTAGGGNVGDRGGALNSPGGASGTNSYGTGGAYANRSGAVGGISTAMGDHSANGNGGTRSAGGNGGRSDNGGGGIGGQGSSNASQASRNGFRHGGYVTTPSGSIADDHHTDNQPIRADEGEFVLRRAAAKALGRGLLRSLNTPAGARRARGLLRPAAR